MPQRILLIKFVTSILNICGVSLDCSIINLNILRLTGLRLKRVFNTRLFDHAGNSSWFILLFGINLTASLNELCLLYFLEFLSLW